MAKSEPAIEVSMGSLHSDGQKIVLGLQFRNVGEGTAHIKRVVLAGDEIPMSSQGIMAGESMKAPVDISGKRVVTDEIGEPQMTVEYHDIYGRSHTTRARVLREKRADGRFNVQSIVDSEKIGLSEDAKPSDRKRKLAEELEELSKTMDVTYLYTHPRQRPTVGWLANVAGVLKNLDEGDHQEFVSFSKAISPTESREDRKRAAFQIQSFMHRKVAEYKRYDWSDLDRPKEKRQGDTYRIGSVGQWNQGDGQSVRAGDVSADQETNVGTADSNWLFKGIVLAVIGGVIAFIIAAVKGWFGFD